MPANEVSPPAEAKAPAAAWQYAFLLLLGLPLVAVLDGGFLWTDASEVLEGRLVAASGRELWEGLSGASDRWDGTYFRPSVLLAHTLSAWTLGLDGEAWRATAVALHALNALQVLAILRALGAGRAALAASALFLVHPVALSPLTWAADRTDLLALVGTLGFALGTVRWAAHGRRLDLVAGVLALLFGLGAKPTAAMVVGPVLVAALGPPGPSRARVRHAAIFAVLVTLGYGVCAWTVVPTAPLVARSMPLTERFVLSVRIHLDYALEFLRPAALSVCDATPVPADQPWLLALLPIAGLLAWRAYRTVVGPSSALLVLVLAWAVCFLLPTSGLLPLRHVRADRYLYLASPALIAAIVLAVGHVCRSRPWALRTATVVAYLGLASAFVQRAERFRSDEALWTWEVARRPTCREGLSYLAREALRAGRAETAADLARRALASDDREVAYVDRRRVTYLLGQALVETGGVEEAVQLWSALAVGDDRVALEAIYMTGTVRAVSGRCAEATGAYDRARSRGLDSAGRCDAWVASAHCAVLTGDRAAGKRMLDAYDSERCTAHARRVSTLRAALEGP